MREITVALVQFKPDLAEIGHNLHRMGEFGRLRARTRRDVDDYPLDPAQGERARSGQRILLCLSTPRRAVSGNIGAAICQADHKGCASA